MVLIHFNKKAHVLEFEAVHLKVKSFHFTLGERNIGTNVNILSCLRDCVVAVSLGLVGIHYVAHGLSYLSDLS